MKAFAADTAYTADTARQLERGTSHFKIGSANLIHHLWSTYVYSNGSLCFFRKPFILASRGTQSAVSRQLTLLFFYSRIQLESEAVDAPQRRPSSQWGQSIFMTLRDNPIKPSLIPFNLPPGPIMCQASSSEDTKTS